MCPAQQVWPRYLKICWWNRSRGRAVVLPPGAERSGRAPFHAAQRSLYHLKEADPHAWVLPRLSGRAKAGMAAVVYDEFGAGRPEQVHARLFADLGALVGHFAAEFLYTEHVEADAVHEQVVRHEVVRRLRDDEPHLEPDMVFGINATGFLEDRLGDRMLADWRD